VIELTDPPRCPMGLGLQQLSMSISGGDIKLAMIKTPEYLLVLEDSLNDKRKQDREKKWNVIAPLVNSDIPGKIFYAGEMGKMVASRAAELGIHRNEIYRLLYKYWINGQVKNALLNNYAGVGVPERQYNAAKPPGRKPKFQGVDLTPTKFLGPTDKKCIKVGYSLYVDDKTSSIVHAYNEMLRKFYTEKVLSKKPERGGFSCHRHKYRLSGSLLIGGKNSLMR